MNRFTIMFLLLAVGGWCRGAAPEITRLKPLYLETDLSRAVIVAPPEFVPAIRQAVGRDLPVADQVAWPLTTHVIAAGSRETNPFIDQLYRRHYCFSDATYPGPGGYELRSIHNPAGGGFNVILLGGDVAKAIPELTRAVRQGKVGHLMRIQLPAGTVIPEDYRQARTHHRMVSTAGICRTGWGWGPGAYELALFYQTGDPKYAKRFLAFAFPDAETRRKYAGSDAFFDGKRPLASGSHYNGFFNILLWDLVEESPVFSDAERLAVTREFLDWSRTGYDGVHAAGSGNDRHGTWQANCRLALARYFAKEYPGRFWTENWQKQQRFFDYLQTPGSWIQGERCIPGWFSSGSLNPSLWGMMLDGRNFSKTSGYQAALDFWEAMYDGSPSSPYLDTAARATFYQVAEITRDGKWLYYADRLPAIQPETFKIGQSFQPGPHLKSRAPEERCGKWLAVGMPEGGRRFFRIAPDPDKAFLALSYRDRLGMAGDLLSFETFSGEYRTPFHALSLFNCRIGGNPVLRGFANYLTVTRDGLASRAVPTYGEVDDFGVNDRHVWLSGRVADAELADWRRTVVLRKSQYLIVGDEIQPHAAGNYNYTLHWSPAPQTNLAVRGNRIVFDPVQELDFSRCELRSQPAGRVRRDGSTVIAELEKVGDWLEIEFFWSDAYDIAMTGFLTRYLDRAEAIDITLNGWKVRRVEKLNDASGWWTPRHPVDFYWNRIQRGRNVLRLTVAAGAPGKWVIGLAGLEIKARGKGQLPGAAIVTAGARGAITGRDYAVTSGSARGGKGEPVRVFSLLSGSDSGEVAGSLIAPNAALFVAKTGRILVWSGRLEPFGEAELAVLAPDGLWARKLSCFNGKSLAAPVDVDWPPEADWAPLFERLRQLPMEETAVAEDSGPVPELPGQLLARVPAPPVAWAACGESLAVATGKCVTVLDARGGVRWQKEFAQPITALGYFAPRQLLLVGTGGTGPLNGEERLNTRVWALAAATGQDGWNFRSEDPAGHHPYHDHRAQPGIFAFATFAGKIAVGSASTVELLHPDGSLFRRYLQNYGKVRILLPTAEYLFCERTNHSPFIQAWRIDVAGNAVKGWNRNLPGFKDFPGFGSMYRTRLFAADFDGDGKTEILGDAQGMYLWLNMYTLDGEPKYQVNLGPGDPTQRPLITAMAVGDLGGDAAPEIAWSDKLGRLAVFDGCLQPRFSRMLGFCPAELTILPQKVLVAVGEKSGRVIDGRGKELGRMTFPAAAVKILPATGGFAVALQDGAIMRYPLPVGLPPVDGCE